MGATRDRAEPRGWRLSIALFQGLLLGGVLFLIMAAVIAFVLNAMIQNTSELLEDKSRLILSSLTNAITRHLDGAEAQLDYIGELIESGELDPSDRRRLQEILAAGLAATPQVSGVIYFDPRGWLIAASRSSDGDLEVEVDEWSDNVAARRAVAEADARGDTQASWGEPVYSGELGTILNLRRPVRRGDEFVGLVAAAFQIGDFSAFVGSLETEAGQNAFILYERERVLAHTALSFGFDGLGPDRPLPRITEIGDPILHEIWYPGWERETLEIGSGHFAQLRQGDYVFLYQKMPDYADAPWLVGSYFQARDIADPVRRMMGAIGFGIAGLALAIVVAFLLGRALRRPIARLAEAAGAVRHLALARVPTLPPSRFRELDDAARAFNAMVAALRGFSLYVPRTLVEALLARGDVATLPSERREITVMFTDIVGFTARTEQLGAEATAAFLNHHFDLVNHCIEAEGGFVDKFIGDGIMALWGAVEPQPDHQVRAVRAAQAIAGAIHTDNKAQANQRVRIRIGIHSGPVVVGNIGAPTRMNYTVIGDTVNAAQRIEVLGRTLLPDAEVAILLSDATAQNLPSSMELRALGSHQLRGRETATQVFGILV